MVRQMKKLVDSLNNQQDTDDSRVENEAFHNESEPKEFSKKEQELSLRRQRRC